MCNLVVFVWLKGRTMRKIVKSTKILGAIKDFASHDWPHPERICHMKERWEEFSTARMSLACFDVASLLFEDNMFNSSLHYWISYHSKAIKILNLFTDKNSIKTWFYSQIQFKYNQELNQSI